MGYARTRERGEAGVGLVMASIAVSAGLGVLSRYVVLSAMGV